MKLENALLQKEKPDGAVEIGSSSFFAVPLPSLYWFICYWYEF